MSEHITKEALVSHKACYWNADGEPRDKLARKVESKLPATLHEIMKWDWVPLGDREWVFVLFATDGEMHAYDQVMAPAGQAYDQVTADASQAYEQATAPAWQAYKQAADDASQAHRQAREDAMIEVTQPKQGDKQ